jgi:S-DNA-T family DNA segregation ATPase FtsK/SpoIIIE
MLALSLLIGLITKSPTMGTFLLISGPAMSLVALLRYRQQSQEVTRETNRILTAYNNRLQQILEIAKGFHDQQLEVMAYNYPPPAIYQEWVVQRSQRLWERRPGHADFLDLRLGTHTASPSYDLRLPTIDIPELAPEPVLAAHRLAAPYLKLEDAPLGWDFARHSSLAIVGQQPLRQSLARAILAQLTSLHAPPEVQLWAIFSQSNVDRWEWLKWLPHTAGILQSGVQPRLAYESDAIQAVLSALLDELETRRLRIDAGQKQDRPTIILLVTDPGLITGEPILEKLISHKDLDMKVLLLASDPYCLPHGFDGWIEIHQSERAVLIDSQEGTNISFNPDQMGRKNSETHARSLAPVLLADETGSQTLPDEIQLIDLLDSPSLENLDLENRWLALQDHPPSLKTTLGIRTGGRPLIINLKQNGHGPHGLIAGTTGSGKSELLLTLLCGLAIDHHPHQVNFVLVDYKGGTAMSVLADLPHTVGLVTDLDGKQTRRALKALRSEMLRREEILAQHQVADIDTYQQHGYPKPFPYLFIVIDEFAELRQHFADDLSNILNEFISVAQKGRALGVHLILAMQKPEGIVSDSIRANMKFRICLRVERIEDSRNVIGRSDAYMLPNRPAGRAYFQVGNDQFDLFQAARVAGPHNRTAQPHTSDSAALDEVGPTGRRVRLNVISPDEERECSSSDGPTRTQAQVLVELARQAGQTLNIVRLPSPWPPPLPEMITLDELLSHHPLKGWNGVDWTGLEQEANAFPRPFPIALADAPASQDQSPLMLDLRAHNNLIVIGAPGSGKSLSLLSMVASLARCHRPDELHLHILAFGGHQFRSCAGEFPHVAGIFDSSDQDRIQRLLTTLSALIESRREEFAKVHAADLSSCRRKSSKHALDPMPAVVVLIDNLSGFLEHLGAELEGWRRLLREGGSYGLYFILSSDRMPPSHLADLIKGRIALQLVDPTWYPMILGGRPDLPSYQPFRGRGFIAGHPPRTIQFAQAYAGEPEQVLNRIQGLAAQMRRAWQGPLPLPIEILPEWIGLKDLLSSFDNQECKNTAGLTAAIGIEAEDLHPVTFDLSRYGPTFLISGPPESGKSTSLFSLAISIAYCTSPERVGMVFVTANRMQSQSWETLASLPHCRALLPTEPEFLEWLTEFENQENKAIYPETILMIMDDEPLWANRVSPQAIQRLESVTRRGEVLGFSLVASLPTVALNGTDGVARALKTARVGLWLKSFDTSEAASVGLRLPHTPNIKPCPAGRGYIYHPGGHQLIQVASPFISSDGHELPRPETLKAWVRRIQDRWPEHANLAGANRQLHSGSRATA